MMSNKGNDVASGRRVQAVTLLNPWELVEPINAGKLPDVWISSQQGFNVENHT